MLIGEHAVVYGHQAIVCAIDQRIHVRIHHIDERIVRIRSKIAPNFTTSLDDLPSKGPLRFVCAAVSAYAAKLKNGLAIEITSEIDPTLGLGSSAAVTVATLAALDKLVPGEATLPELHGKALTIVRELQGRGSGADLAASVFGGMLAYATPEAKLVDGDRAYIHQLPQPPQLSLRYSGYKTPTADVLKTIAEAMHKDPEIHQRLYKQMGNCSSSAIKACEEVDWQRLAELMSAYNNLMKKLGVSDKTLELIIAEASTAMAAKISGSGLGDCVIALGDVPQGFKPVELSKQGVIVNG